MKRSKGRRSPVPLQKKSGAAGIPGPAPLLDRIEGRLQGRSRLFLAFTIALSFVFSLLLFDVKISEGNDDSMYIESGFFFAQNFTGFYTPNAPLYPMMLSLPIRLFGVNLVLLKFFSLLFSIGHIMVFYFSFKKRVPWLVLLPVLFIISVNSYYLYFASQTYTEAFFMLIQGLLIYYMLNVIDSRQGEDDLRKTWATWLVIGFIFLLLLLCKNVALAAIPALVLFFLLQKRYKPIAFFLGSVVIFRGAFEVLRGFIWERSDQFASQTAILLQKDPYNPAKGQEDLAGFIGRFFGNIDLYISKRFYQILGFRGADEITVNAALSFVTVFILVVAVVTVIRRKHRVLLFTGLYALSMAGLTFLVLQIRWDQPRYFIVYVHYFLLVILFGFYTWFNRAGYWTPRLYILLVIIVAGSTLLSTVKKSAANMSTLKKNISGDIYYGFTQDYVNYLKMSKWCADSLPSDAYVAARKAPMSFIYSGGKQFYPVYTTISTNPDSALTHLKSEGVTHVILASLRRNPKAADGYIINTMHRMIQPIAVTYPGKLSFVKRIGTSEPADLYKINY